MTRTAEEGFDAIQRRAYEISQQPDRGCDSENWAGAERELTLGTHEPSS